MVSSAKMEVCTLSISRRSFSRGFIIVVIYMNPVVPLPVFVSVICGRLQVFRMYALLETI